MSIPFVCVIFYMISNGELLQPILLAVCWIYRNCREWRSRERRYKIEQKVCQKVEGNIFLRAALPGCSQQSWPHRPLRYGRQRAEFRFENFLSHCVRIVKPSGHYKYRPVVTIYTAEWSLYVPQNGHCMYRTVVTICTAQWSLYVPHSGHYMYHKFNI